MHEYLVVERKSKKVVRAKTTVSCLLLSDCRRGQSLVVHAINEGRQAARQIDLDLMGRTSLASNGGVVTSTRTAEGLLDELWSRPPPVTYDTDNYSDAGSLA